MNHPKISKLFTVRNRPVLFTRTDGRYSESLHAIERGAFPVSPSGYHSLCGILRDCRDNSEFPFDEEAIHSVIESIAAKGDESYRKVLTHAQRAARMRPDGSVSHFISLDTNAIQAVRFGFFANNETRTKLWQVAYRLFRMMCEDGHFSPKKMAESGAPAWYEAACRTNLDKAQKQFAFLRQLMAGDFNLNGLDHNELFYSTSHYFSLPPKPDGEPVIAPLSTELTFGFMDGLIADPDEEEDSDEEDEKYGGDE